MEKYLKVFQSVLFPVRITIFLRPRTGFARIFSCISISHIIHKEAPREIEEGTNYSNSSSCVRGRYILPNSQKILQRNSDLLSKLAESIELEFKANVIVERKFTTDRQFLADITIDYRHLKDWKSYKNRLEPSLKEIIQKYRSFSLDPMSDLYAQAYDPIHSGYLCTILR